MDFDLAMKRAITIAQPLRVHPNPTVGCLILDASGGVVGEGVHPGPGMPHAEVEALREAGARAVGGTAIVTLEPCSHHGRTPPCTEALTSAGIARVVFGAVDPDPRVSGVECLAAAGIEVVGPIATEAVEAIDSAYFHHRRHGRPLVTLKAAMTLDGSTAALDGTSRWITGASAREDAHALRASVDAVMVGAGTVRVDDPQLTVRLAGYDGPQPCPVVVAGRQPLPEGARLAGRDPLVIATTTDHPWGQVVTIPPGGDGLPGAHAIVDAVAAAGLLSVMVEGGARLAASLWHGGVVDRLVLYYGGLMAGGSGIGLFDEPFPTLDAAAAVRVTEVRAIGDDVRIDCERG